MEDLVSEILHSIERRQSMIFLAAVNPITRKTRKSSRATTAGTTTKLIVTLFMARKQLPQPE